MTRVVAVFTGDLTGSRKADPGTVDTAMAALRNATQSFGTSHKSDLRFTRNRGDGWQILLPDARLSLALFIVLTAGLRASGTGLETKTAIGLGPIDTPGTHDLSDAAGAAFITSGDLLEHLSATSGPQRAAIAGPTAQTWHSGILRMADLITQGWSAHQAEAVALYMLEKQHETHAARARALGISRQAFEARLRSSGFWAFDAAHEAFMRHDFEATV